MSCAEPECKSQLCHLLAVGTGEKFFMCSYQYLTYMCMSLMVKGLKSSEVSFLEVRLSTWFTEGGLSGETCRGVREVGKGWGRNWVKMWFRRSPTAAWVHRVLWTDSCSKAAIHLEAKA